MDFVEVPPGKYVVGVGPDAPRLLVSPQQTWPQYPLATDELMIEVNKPFQISRDLVTTHQYQRAMKQPIDGPDEPVALSFLMARRVAGKLGAKLPTWFEWEIATRGPEPFLYPWGNELDTTKLELSRHSYSDDQEFWVLDSFGDYAGTESPFGLRDLARVGCEWNETVQLARGRNDAVPLVPGTSAVVRSLCDVGAMRYMVPGIRPGRRHDAAPTWSLTANTFAERAFSGPIAACYGLEKPDLYRSIIDTACFRLVRR